MLVSVARENVRLNTAQLWRVVTGWRSKIGDVERFRLTLMARPQQSVEPAGAAGAPVESSAPYQEHRLVVLGRCKLLIWQLDPDGKRLPPKVQW